VWVWRSVLRPIGGALTHVLASFPDEAHAYASIGVPTTFVGHYLAESVQPVTNDERLEARRALNLPVDARVVALLPGSRAQEIRRLAARMCAAARVLEQRNPPVHAVVAVADGFGSALDDVIRASGCGARMVPGTRMALQAADVALCCSGTATLEAALLGIPMAVAYRTSWLTYWLLQAGISVGVFESDTIALPNLLLGRRMVPELHQADADPQHLSAAAAALLDDEPGRDAMREVLGKVRAQIMAGPTVQTVADLVIAQAAA
jgi:lipid-A-disaccharide synthase